MKKSTKFDFSALFQFSFEICVMKTIILSIFVVFSGLIFNCINNNNQIEILQEQQQQQIGIISMIKNSIFININRKRKNSTHYQATALPNIQKVSRHEFFTSGSFLLFLLHAISFHLLSSCFRLFAEFERYIFVRFIHRFGGSVWPCSIATGRKCMRTVRVVVDDFSARWLKPNEKHTYTHALSNRSRSCNYQTVVFL